MNRSENYVPLGEDHDVLARKEVVEVVYDVDEIAQVTHQGERDVRAIEYEMYEPREDDIVDLRLSEGDVVRDHFRHRGRECHTLRHRVVSYEPGEAWRTVNPPRVPIPIAFDAVFISADVLGVCSLGDVPIVDPNPRSSRSAASSMR